MKKRSFAFLLIPAMLMLLTLFTAAALPRTARADGDPNPSGTPDNLRVPDNEVLIWDGVTGDGQAFQDYVCTANGDSYSWVGVGPDAYLYGSDGSSVYHSAVSYQPGFTPQWTLNGSTVAGHSIANAPQDGTIPWLLLQSVSNTPGDFGNVNYIQRLYTSGGTTPTDTCDADNVDAFEGVPYYAHYYFYAPAE